MLHNFKFYILQPLFGFSFQNVFQIINKILIINAMVYYIHGVV